MSIIIPVVKLHPLQWVEDDCPLGARQPARFPLTIRQLPKPQTHKNTFLIKRSLNIKTAPPVIFNFVVTETSFEGWFFVADNCFARHKYVPEWKGMETPNWPRSKPSLFWECLFSREPLTYTDKSAVRCHRWIYRRRCSSQQPAGFVFLSVVSGWAECGEIAAAGPFGTFHVHVLPVHLLCISRSQLKPWTTSCVILTGARKFSKTLFSPPPSLPILTHPLPLETVLPPRRLANSNKSAQIVWPFPWKRSVGTGLDWENKQLTCVFLTACFSGHRFWRGNWESAFLVINKASAGFHWEYRSVPW